MGCRSTPQLYPAAVHSHQIGTRHNKTILTRHVQIKTCQHIDASSPLSGHGLASIIRELCVSRSSWSRSLVRVGTCKPPARWCRRFPEVLVVGVCGTVVAVSFGEGVVAGGGAVGPGPSAGDPQDASAADGDHSSADREQSDPESLGSQSRPVSRHGRARPQVWRPIREDRIGNGSAVATATTAGSSMPRIDLSRSPRQPLRRGDLERPQELLHGVRGAEVLDPARPTTRGVHDLDRDRPRRSFQRPHGRYERAPYEPAVNTQIRSSEAGKPHR